MEEYLDNDVVDVEETEGVDETVFVDGFTGERVTSVLKAVRKHCLQCSCYQREEVKLCPCTSCNLWPFRFGKNPYRKKRILTDEQKEAIRQRMEKARNK